MFDNVRENKQDLIVDIKVNSEDEDDKSNDDPNMDFIYPSESNER